MNDRDRELTLANEAEDTWTWVTQALAQLDAENPDTLF